MRTNIELNDDLMSEAKKYARATTKRAIVEEALRTFVEVKEQERRRNTYLDRLRSLREELAGLTLRTPPHVLLREDRERQ